MKYVVAAQTYSRIGETRCENSQKEKSRLSRKAFFVASPATIINLEEIESIETWFSRTFQVQLKNSSQPLAVSRRYAVKLKNNFT